ncbi:MAG: carbamate kinase [Candidatus Eisenbacteria bacterium]
MPISPHRRRAVIALGGNSITRSGEEGTVDQDYRNLEESLECVIELVTAGYEIVVTHGNGPQIGNQMIRVELAKGEAPDLPLDVMGADIQGGLGYMIERVLRSKLRARGLQPRVCCLLMMVEVDPNDPSMQSPTKFVGPFYTEEQANRFGSERGWKMKKDANRGWRRVVPSPDPIGIVERHELTMLLEAGSIVISGGGGGIPVARSATGELKGVEAVVDKDLSSTIIALNVDAPELFILTGVDRVKLNYGTPEETAVAMMSVKEARRYLADGQFPAGSMGPKIDAACRFIEGGGGRALITDDAHLASAIRGDAGTWITI